MELRHIQEMQELRSSLEKQEYFTFSQAARLMGVSRQYIYKLVKEDKLRASRISGRMALVRRADIELMLKSKPYERLVAKNDFNISEYYTAEEIAEKYKVNAKWVWTYTRQHKVPKVRIRQFNYYSKKHIDAAFAKYEVDSDLTEWYTPEEIQEKYGMTRVAIRSQVYRNNIPSKKEHGQIFYSKLHFDLSKSSEQESKAEYYTVKEAMEKFKLSRDSVYGILQFHQINREKNGRFVRFLKVEFDLSEDQKYILDQILNIAEESKVDAVLIAGDVYDKAVPSEAATKLLDYFLSRLSCMGVDTFVISGNHDSDDRLNYGSSLFEINRIYISSVFDGTMHKRTIQDEYGDVDVYMLPFIKASQVKHYYKEEKIDSYEDAVRTVIEHTDIDEDRRNVLIAHQFVAGRTDDESTDPVPGGSEGVTVKSVGLVEKIGYDCFDKFDYVALGHIHSPQRVGRDEVRYSGSPLKYSLSEVNNTKSVPVVTLTAKNNKKNVEIELVELKPVRDLRHIKGKLDTLLDSKYIDNQNDFMYVTLTDESVINDAMGIIQQVYPNTVKIDYDNSHTKQIEQSDISHIAEDKNFTELIEDFYRQMYGTDMSDEEIELMNEVAKEAGVI